MIENLSISKIIANLLNRIPLGIPRVIFVVGVMLAFLITVRLIPQLVGIPVVLGLLAYMTYKLILRIVGLFPLVMRRTIRKLWRMVRTTRQFYKIPEEVEFFHAVTIIVALLSMIYLLVTKDASGYGILNYVIAIFLGAAAVFDVSSRISWLVKKAWAKMLGKLFFAGMGAALVFVSAAISKQFVHEITHADPQYFQEFVSLLTSIYTPILFGFALCAVVLTFAILELVGMILALWLAVPILSIILQLIVGKNRCARIFYRIRTGKQAPVCYQPESFEWRGLICFMRPTALALAVYVVTTSISAVTSFASPTAKDWGARILVLMHYHKNISCENLNKDALIADLKDGDSVSVASFGTNTAFVTKACKHPTLPEL